MSGLAKTFLALMTCSNAFSHADEMTAALAGAWMFRLDEHNVGITEKWFTQTFDDSV
jgi:hypothetical protein